jgi:hypothetical protein
MNQSRGHWLLSNTLTTTIALTINMEITLLLFFGGLEISDSFESEILALQRNMRLKVIKVIKPFL